MVRTRVPELLSAHTVRQINNAPTFEALGRTVLTPGERKDKGAIRYSTVPRTIQHWAEDPFGKKKLDFISKAYGIPRRKLPDILSEAGLSEYLKAKAEGRMVGMVFVQILKPSYFFLANLFVLADLTRKGIPTALMIGEYTEDKFHTANPDKRDAFGKIDFPIGIKNRIVNGKSISEIQTIKIELRPYGIRHDDGRITRISSIDEANGYRCEQVLVQVTDALSPDNQPYAKDLSEAVAGSKNHIKTTETYYQAALGFSIPGLVNKRKVFDKKEVEIPQETKENVISIIDFYKELWMETIKRLRKTNDLPTDEEMPIFFVDGLQKMYTTLANYAQPPKKILEIMAFSSHERVLKEVLHLSNNEVATILAGGEESFKNYLASRDLRQLDNGLLVHMNGMLDAAAYYPAQMAWPDVYLDCSCCGGDYFVNKVERAQMVRRHYKLPESQVHLPDLEVPELEKLVMHPTGKFYNPNQPIDPRLVSLTQKLRTLPEQVTSQQLTKHEAEEMKKKLAFQIAEIGHKQKKIYYAGIEKNNSEDYSYEKPYIPEIIAATYKLLLDGVQEKISERSIQEVIRKIKKYEELSDYLTKYTILNVFNRISRFVWK